MKSILIKIIFVFCIAISINACHTFEHQNILFQNINKNVNQELFDKGDNNLNQELLDKGDKNLKVNDKNSKENSEMAPIDTPKQTAKVKKLALQNKVKEQIPKKTDLEKFINWNEQKLIEALGKSDFIKEEGKLKNYQYYYKKCFLDVFLIRKEENYIVSYVETRPTKLDGVIDINACLNEINKIIK